jgi:predicted metal-binding membrane protein
MGKEKNGYSDEQRWKTIVIFVFTHNALSQEKERMLVLISLCALCKVAWAIIYFLCDTLAREREREKYISAAGLPNSLLAEHSCSVYNSFF